MSSEKATIFDIQRFSIHDGPGIRTLIFFKGCSLHCSWCQNPESIKIQKEIAFYEEKCIGCGRCVGVCPHNAIILDSNKRIDYKKCNICGKCAEICPSNAIRVVGKSFSTKELLSESLKDRDFYDTSGGGITLSGGEPILHSSFLLNFLPMLKENGLHILLETAGNYSFSLLKPLLQYLDRIYFDFKFPDTESYFKYTGSNNNAVINNLKKLLALPFPMDVRIPLIPGINTLAEHLDRFCSSLIELNIDEVQLLRYNFLWEAKIPRLNTEQKKLGLSDDCIDYNAIAEHFSRNSIRANLSE